MGGAMLSTRQSSRLRQIVIVCVGLLALYVLFIGPDESLDSSRTWVEEFSDTRRSKPGKAGLSEELLNTRFLTDEQCAAAFPRLTQEIDNAVEKGPFKLEKSGPLGPLIARIKDGKVCIYKRFRDVKAHNEAKEMGPAKLEAVYNSGNEKLC
jgi:hypothetical protein